MHLKAVDIGAQFFPMRWLRKKAGVNLVMPVYHAIAYSEEVPYLQSLYHIFDEYTFEQHIDQLLRHFKPIDLFQLHAYFENGFPQGNYFFLSFDDGLRSCYHNVAPILKEKGVPATFFLNSSFIDNKQMFHRLKSTHLYTELKRRNILEELSPEEIDSSFDTKVTSYKQLRSLLINLRYPQNQALDTIAEIFGINFTDFLELKQPYMTTTQVKSLLRDGFTIGAHSCDHPEYYLIDQEEQIRQTVTCMKELETQFGINYRTFAFPFTDVGVKASFYSRLFNEHNFDFTFGCSGIKKDEIRTNLHRIPMDVSTMHATPMIKSELAHYILKRLVGKHIYQRE